MAEALAAEFGGKWCRQQGLTNFAPKLDSTVIVKCKYGEQQEQQKLQNSGKLSTISLKSMLLKLFKREMGVYQIRQN